MTELFELAQALRDEHGTDWDAVLVDLRGGGANIVQSAVITSRVLGVNLGIAKRIVHFSPVWQDERSGAEELHAMLEASAFDVALAAKAPETR